ncbi:hypothetical protein FKP32DRAFT_1681572 [Trametes sanguinea]|nr:hypothetical protein FKP32DRAFT_1681572 [Trametes sanguinea]
MAANNTDALSHRAELGRMLAQDLVHRRLRGVRAFILPLRGPAGFRDIPVARLSMADHGGIDIPVLTDTWTVSGVIDEDTIPMPARSMGRRGRNWEHYNIWYIRPHDRNAPTRSIEIMGSVVSVPGEFIIVRRSPDGSRLLDMRRMDHARVDAILIR